MKENIVHEKADFFNEDQKKVKQEIMQKLLDSWNDTMRNNQNLFPDIQSVADMFTSILLMFNRDMLIWFFDTFLIHKKNELMDELFLEIKEQVINSLKEKMN